MDILNSTLTLAAFLFSVGLIIVITRKNAIFVLIGIELMLNAANLNFVAFGSTWNKIDGQFFSLFVMVLAAAEAAIALAIILKVYHHYQSSNLDDIKELGG